MNFKMKALVAATAMVVASGANAAIDQGGAFFAGDGTGELFLMAVERDAGNNEVQAYARDLNIDATEIMVGGLLTNGSTWAADSDMANFLGAVGAGSTVSWSIGGHASGYLGVGSDFSDNGYFLTSNQDVNAQAPTQAGASLSSAVQNLTNQATQVNNKLVTALNTDSDDSIRTVAANDGKLYDTVNWTSQWAGSGMGNVEAGLGASANFWLVNLSTVTFDNGVPNSFPYQFTLETDGDLIYGSSVAAVPLPPALWLLGSALIGLAGVTRRQAEVVAA